MRLERNWRARCRALWLTLFALPLAVGCSSKSDEPVVQIPAPRAELCNAPARSSERIPMRNVTRASAVRKEVFNTLKERVDAQCGQCHRTPQATAGFQYTSDYEGLKAAAPRMAALATQGAMPPVATAEQTRDAAALGCALESWMAQGSPETGSFDVKCEQEPSTEGTQVAFLVAQQMTDLGNCIPTQDQLGSDPEKDAYFARLTALPRSLSETDTDIVTFDTVKLARHGTFAFAPTYPLFSDHAKKLRLVHVPAGKSIEYDAATKQFKIPPNTRFYKTFFKAVKNREGDIEYRRIETRLIVTRERWQDALFGTYIWNDQGTAAELHDLRYRDGSPFSDRVLVYTTDEARGDTRNYAIPARHRCVNCHTGSEGQNFVLGFTPLQVNRREQGEGGTDPLLTVDRDELSQVDRLIRYGVITGLRSAEELPKLEDLKAKGKEYRNEHELALQGYFVGNCAQCHNPNGFAVESNPSIADLDFSPGGVMAGFDTRRMESNGQKYYADVRAGVDFERDLRAASPSSTFYQRVVQDAHEVYIHMPANVPGRDCRLVGLVAKWLGSLERASDNALTPEERVAARDARVKLAGDVVWETCKDPRDVRWVSEDFTDRIPYEPRNRDWRLAIQEGSHRHLMDYAITERHEQLATKLFPTSFWVARPECSFEEKPEPAVVEPWMVDDLGIPKQPWSELYYTTPGATVFQGICSNCHGRTGDGQSGAAKALVARSGARVANLVTGISGTGANGVSHLKAFEDALGPHGGAKYLVFMGTGGTRVEFGDAFMQAWVKYGEVDIDFSGDAVDWGKWGANMLGAARGACDLVRVGRFGTGASSEPKSGNPRAIGGATMWKEICTVDNPLTDAVRNGDTVAYETWLRRAEFNAGVMAYFYLKDHLAQGKPPALLRSECHKRQPASASTP
ncbi:hypothetical protein HPC49_20990 [Pyxidicoccus fallax]|uniref:Cytochrome c domain-containing protein n=1 Tax=Pyxidicoccus fallax TaxID=394095 RepID=A0A848LRI2_9BACT|nr:hypothetical protein [Pyxidicoccus fallax]NMO20064.1 hypothetical protein [Pyxidicoccus fallax]NPC80690.1 hypothetical protein [Pyxidicoccus fallax]